jgi:hypothetical protein
MSKNIFQLRKEREIVMRQQMIAPEIHIPERLRTQEKINPEKEKAEQIKNKLSDLESIRKEAKEKKDKRPETQKQLIDELGELPKRKLIIQYLKQFVV